MSNTDTKSEPGATQEESAAMPEADARPASKAKGKASSNPDTQASSKPGAKGSSAAKPKPSSKPAAAADPSPAGTGGRGLAGIALTVAAVALILASWAVWQRWMAADDTADPAVAALERGFDATRKRLESLEQAVGGVETTAGQAKSDAAGFRGELDASRRELETLSPRVATLESSMASLAGVSQGARNAWLVAEAEYYMQIANAQLQLAGNPELAALALKMADERIAQLSDPGLTEVRRALSAELAALDALEKPDIEGVSLTLASLARVVETLPLAGTDEAPDAAAVDGDETSGAGRAWSSVKNAMSGLVRVTPPDSTRLPQLTPDTEFFLRSNIALQLQAARLALLRGEQSIFEQTLDDTSALLRDYFDNRSAPVASARETIAEIRGTTFAVGTPDISESLRLLRQFRARTGNGQ